MKISNFHTKGGVWPLGWGNQAAYRIGKILIGLLLGDDPGGIAARPDSPPLFTFPDTIPYFLLVDCRTIVKCRVLPKRGNCICCMGGNCFAIGHVIDDCDCFCKHRDPIPEGSDHVTSQAFKLSYYQGCLEYENLNHKGTGNKVEEACLLWDTCSENWGDVMGIK